MLAPLALALVPAARVLVPGGDYVPTVPAGSPPVHVEPFRMDERPVTNGEFLFFVRSHAQWSRGQVPALLADRDYLTHWREPAGDAGPKAGRDAARDTAPDPADTARPVTRVSWYAARAYCQAAGGRLPTWAEWELVAAADDHARDARASEAWRASILAWYAQPADAPPADAGSGPPNAWGLRDLHGLVWEWVEDFDSLLMGADSRLQGDPDRLAFCGAGAAAVQDRENYPMLMRLAFLDALRAASTARTLGFRCAYAVGP